MAQVKMGGGGTYTEQCEEVLGNRTIYLFNREHLRMCGCGVGI